jgi:P27 family predicted phage terminase small subunit
VPRGRRPMPAALHALRGNPGKRKHVADPTPLPAEGEPQTIDGSVVELRVPRPPAGLSAAAKKHWRRLAPMLLKNGLLRATDQDSLATLCRLEAEDEALAKLATAKNRYYTVNGIVRRHPAVADRQKLTKDLRDYRDRFGLSPQARARVPIGGAQQPNLPFPEPPHAAQKDDARHPHESPAAGDPLDGYLAERPGLPN